MKKLLTFAAFCLILLASTTTIFAQATATSEVRGQVTDPNGAVVAGADVTATDTTKGTSRTVKTDSNGEYVILALQPSTYEVKVVAANFAEKTTSNVILQVGQQYNLPIQIGVGNVGAQVDVTETQDVVEPERTQQSSVISTRQIENLPINRRNFLDFALLTPGVVSSERINDTTDARVIQTPTSNLSFAGNNGRGNSITVDGASADTASGAARDVVSQEGVQEFQINRNSYGAEYGGASGGIVNIVSKTGGNDFHGSAFGYFRDKSLDSRNPFDNNPNGKSPFNRQQFGGSVGGKIYKDKTFFFGAAEGFREKRTSFVSLSQSLNDGFSVSANSQNTSQDTYLRYLATIPGFAATSASLRATLTSPSASTRTLFTNASGQFPFKASNSLYSARFDHNFSDNDTAFLRVNYSHSHNENQSTGALDAVSYGSLLESHGSQILLSETHLFNPTTINEAKFLLSYYDLFVTPNDPIGPSINISGYGSFGRQIFQPSQTIDKRVEFSDNLSLVRGSHTIKIGGLFQNVIVRSNSETYVGGRFQFGALPINTLLGGAAAPASIAVATAITNDASLSPVQRAGLLGTTINGLQAYSLNLAQVYQQAFGDPFLKLTAQRYSLFAQDTWKLRPNITFNYGVRYFLDKEPSPVPVDKNNFQPRAGISWDIFNNARTVVRAGAGIFTGTVDNQIVNVTNTLASGTQPYSLNIVTSTAQIPGAAGSINIYRTLLAQGVIGTRTIRASDLTQFGVSTAPGRLLEARIRLSPDFKSAETYQASAAIQQNLGYGFSAEASYLYVHGSHIVRPTDVRNYAVNNSPITCPNGTVQTLSCYSLQPRLIAEFGSAPPFPKYALDAVYSSTANSTYNAGTLVVTKRFSNNFSLNANYTYSKSIDETTDYNTDFLAQNPLDRQDDRSLSSFDQRHKVVVSGVATSSSSNIFLKDFVFSPILQYGSGRPFNLVLGFDDNADSRTLSDRPAGVGRNTGKGDSFYSVDFRLARRFFAKDRRYLELTFEGFNVLNTVNFNGVNNVVGTACVANLRTNPNCPASTNPLAANNLIIPFNARPIQGNSPTQPLGYTSASAARQFQVGARFNF